MLVLLHFFYTCILNWMHMHPTIFKFFSSFQSVLACDGVKIWLENTGVCLVTYLFISLLAIYIIILGILQIKNLSAMEVNIVRPFIGRALQAFYKHDSSDLIPDPERVSDRRQQVAHNAPRVCLFDTLLRNVSCTNKINRLLICYVLFVRVLSTICRQLKHVLHRCSIIFDCLVMSKCVLCRKW